MSSEVLVDRLGLGIELSKADEKSISPIYLVGHPQRGVVVDVPGGSYSSAIGISQVI